MTKQSVYLVTYDRGTYDMTGKVKPYHLSYYVQLEFKEGRRRGIAHQLHGMPGAFHYDAPVELYLVESGPLLEESEIGDIDKSQVTKIFDILKTIKIDKRESSGWKCQDWSLEGFEMLKGESFIYNHLTRDGVKAWLKEKDQGSKARSSTTSNEGSSSIAKDRSVNTSGLTSSSSPP